MLVVPLCQNIVLLMTAQRGWDLIRPRLVRLISGVQVEISLRSALALQQIVQLIRRLLIVGRRWHRQV